MSGVGEGLGGGWHTHSPWPSSCGRILVFEPPPSPPSPPPTCMHPSQNRHFCVLSLHRFHTPVLNGPSGENAALFDATRAIMKHLSTPGG